VRLLVSARSSGDLFDLRCAVRERMLAFLAAHHPEALPLLRIDVTCNEAWHTDGQSHAGRRRCERGDDDVAGCRGRHAGRFAGAGAAVIHVSFWTTLSLFRSLESSAMLTRNFTYVSGIQASLELSDIGDALARRRFHGRRHTSVWNS
jgi:hypothetical protein